MDRKSTGQPAEAFNGLTPAQAERLAMLAEECGEIIQVVGKILRHGYDSFHPDNPKRRNGFLLGLEIADFSAVERLMSNAGDPYYKADDDDVAEAMRRKLHYAHHQPAAVAAEAVPISQDALIDLIGEFGQHVHNLIDDCETSGPVGQEIHTITTEALNRVSAILDRIDALPFEVPGEILGPGAMLQEAIKRTFAPPAAPAPGIAEASHRLIVGFMLDCNAIGHIAAAENLVRGIKETARGTSHG